MLKTIALLLLLPAVLSAADTSTTASKSCVALRITNGYGRSVAIASGPANLAAEVRVQQSDAHRYIIVAWDYAPPDASEARSMFLTDDAKDQSDVDVEQHDGSIGSEERSLMGVEQPTRLEDFKLHRLEGGTFLVTATVYMDEDRTRACGRATARVIVR